MKWIPVAYVILSLTLIVGGVFGYLETRPEPFSELADIQPSSTPTPVATISDAPIAVPTATPTPSPTNTPLPTSVTLSVPFTSQAPYGKWDDVHEHTCEESSLLMAQWYAQGKAGAPTNGYKNQIPLATAESAMLAMNAWEEKVFGSAKDTNTEQTARIATEFLGLKNVSVKTTVTEQSLKQELANGNVIIIPVAGRQIGNPYFQPPGPPYHMLVLTGYTGSHFIANDPGTRHGENYLYPIGTIVSAIHDWLGQESTILQGPKKILVIGKE